MPIPPHPLGSHLQTCDVLSLLGFLPQGSHLLAKHPRLSNSWAEARMECHGDNQRDRKTSPSPRGAHRDCAQVWWRGETESKTHRPNLWQPPLHLCDGEMAAGGGRGREEPESRGISQGRALNKLWTMVLDRKRGIQIQGRLNDPRTRLKGSKGTARIESLDVYQARM